MAYQIDSYLFTILYRYDSVTKLSLFFCSQMNEISKGYNITPTQPRPSLKKKNTNTIPNIKKIY